MPDILVEASPLLGRIRLNRPKALSRCSMHGRPITTPRSMGSPPRPASPPSCSTGEGERGLCAGGDLRSLYDSEPAQASRTPSGGDEYRLDARIAAFHRPFVAILDGITMGGGVGLSGHARHRIVTERSRIAMPETGIGYLPDVGGTWLLPRAPGETGTYLGLTGEPMGAADAIFAGFADTLVPVAALPASSPRSPPSPRRPATPPWAPIWAPRRVGLLRSPRQAGSSTAASRRPRLRHLAALAETAQLRRCRPARRFWRNRPRASC